MVKENISEAVKVEALPEDEARDLTPTETVANPASGSVAKRALAFAARPFIFIGSAYIQKQKLELQTLYSWISKPVLGAISWVLSFGKEPTAKLIFLASLTLVFVLEFTATKWNAAKDAFAAVKEHGRGTIELATYTPGNVKEIAKKLSAQSKYLPLAAFVGVALAAVISSISTVAGTLTLNLFAAALVVQIADVIYDVTKKHFKTTTPQPAPAEGVAAVPAQDRGRNAPTLSALGTRVAKTAFWTTTAGATIGTFVAAPAIAISGSAASILISSMAFTRFLHNRSRVEGSWISRNMKHAWYAPALLSIGYATASVHLPQVALIYLGQATLIGSFAMTLTPAILLAREAIRRIPNSTKNALISEQNRTAIRELFNNGPKAVCTKILAPVFTILKDTAGFIRANIGAKIFQHRKKIGITLAGLLGLYLGYQVVLPMIVSAVTAAVTTIVSPVLSVLSYGTSLVSSFASYGISLVSRFASGCQELWNLYAVVGSIVGGTIYLIYSPYENEISAYAKDLKVALEKMRCKQALTDGGLTVGHKAGEAPSTTVKRQPIPGTAPGTNLNTADAARAVEAPGKARTLN